MIDLLKIKWKEEALNVEHNWTRLPLPQTKSMNGEDIDEDNKKMFDDLVNSHLHLELIIRYEVIYRDANKGTRKEREAEETAVLKQTLARTVSLIPVCLRYLTWFCNFERKVKLVDVMKCDKYTILGAYLLEGTMRLVNEVKAGDKIEIPIL